MFGSLRSMGLVAGFLASTTMGAAAAQTVTVVLSTGSTGLYSVGGWTFSLAGCGVTSGTGQTNTACGSDEVIATATAASLSLVFQTVTPGGNLLLANTTGSNGTIADLSLTNIAVTAPGSEPIYSVSLGVTGSVPTGGNTAKVSSSTGAITQTSNAATLDSSLQTSLAASPTLAGIAPTTGGVSLNVDSKASAFGTSIPAGNYVLTSTTLTYNAPEPMSLSLLAFGAVGVIAARRRGGRNPA